MQEREAGSSNFHVLMIVTFITSLFLGLKGYVSGDSFIIPDLQSLLVLSALALMSQVAGWILITNALPKIRASLAGLVLLMQPALAFVWDVLFFQRETSFLNWVGVGTALAAIYMGMKRG
jgi:drug/metabolite transporter (DMT)-like permease